ncbi:MAG: GNAT family N-acetyltransferase [Pseudomonadales bacterium]|nr:GNAT family N-acetyltransferase [Pseudomonadales bacterium]
MTTHKEVYWQGFRLALNAIPGTKVREVDSWTVSFDWQGLPMAMTLLGESNLDDVLELDKASFQAQDTLSREDTLKIFQDGIMVALRIGSNTVACTQLILHNSDLLGFELESNQVFSAGTFLHPDHRGSGLGQLLVRLQKHALNPTQFDTVVVSVRLENHKALRMRFQENFFVYSVSEQAFSEMGEDSYRLMLFWSKTPFRRDSSSHNRTTPQWLPVDFSQNIDLKARAEVATLLKMGALGIALEDRLIGTETRQGIVFVS